MTRKTLLTEIPEAKMRGTGREVVNSQPEPPTRRISTEFRAYCGQLEQAGS